MTKEFKNITVMFPYPSGSGLHCGHWYNYAIMDSYCRYRLSDMKREKIPKLKIEKDFLLSYIRCYRSGFLKIFFLFSVGIKSLNYK